MPVDPGGILELVVHEIGAALGHDQVAPPALTTTSETQLELLGVASVKAAPLQLLGPRLVTTCVYVMVFPAATGLGVPAFVTARSHATFTLVVTDVLLLLDVGSDVVADTDDVAVIVPIATLDGTLSTTTMSAVFPELRFAVSVQVIVPVPPTAGVVQLQPAGADADWNVVFVGVASVKLTPVAAAGPLFVTLCV